MTAHTPTTPPAAEAPVDKQIVDALLHVLHDRKGFEWWWDEIGARNRAEIKRKMRQETRKRIKAEHTCGGPCEACG
jgi:hypothetical protein